MPVMLCGREEAGREGGREEGGKREETNEESRVLVIREGAAVLKLLAGKDQPLLVRRDALLVLDLLLHVLDRVRRLDVERDGLAGQGFDEDLHVLVIVDVFVVVAVCCS